MQTGEHYGACEVGYNAFLEADSSSHHELSLECGGNAAALALTQSESGGVAAALQREAPDV